MPTTNAQKLKIKENATLLALNAPPEFRKNMGALPAGVRIVTTGRDYQQVHWFVLNKAKMETEMKKVLGLMKPDTLLWIYYPKGSSTFQTDLTRDKGWESLLAFGDWLTWTSLVSFDNTWSVFGCRHKSEADKKKEKVPRPVRQVFNYVNAATKEVRLPDDLERAMKKNRKEAELFKGLSFTNKKEFIEWIVSAKREETRMERVKGTIEKLGKGWRNPTNR